MGLVLNTDWLPLAAASGEESHGIGFVGIFAYTLFVVAIVLGLMHFARKGLDTRVFKNPITQLFEQLYLFIENMTVGTIGSHGRKYIPIIMTFWCVIFVSNVVSLFFPTAPTADVGFNLGMALIAIAYVQYEGIKANGFFGHFSHFAGPKLPGILIIINVLIFGIEIISELLKNVSLSLRLYGNIEGGHLAAAAMNELGKEVYIPFGAFLLPIKLLTCVVQALIFTLLTCVYLSLVTHHEHPDEHGHLSDEDERAAGAKYTEALVH